jgi:hypothetical protein
MPGFRPAHVIIHPDLERAYVELEAGARQGRKEPGAIWKSFQKALDRVKADGQWGEVIPRVPSYFAERYGARNL